MQEPVGGVSLCTSSIASKVKVAYVCISWNGGHGAEISRSSLVLHLYLLG